MTVSPPITVMTVVVLGVLGVLCVSGQCVVVTPSTTVTKVAVCGGPVLVAVLFEIMVTFHELALRSVTSAAVLATMAAPNTTSGKTNVS